MPQLYIASEHMGLWSYTLIKPLLRHAFPNTEIIEWNTHHLPTKRPDLIIRATHSHLQSAVCGDEHHIPYMTFSGESFCAGWRSYPPIIRCETLFTGREIDYMPYFLFHPLAATPQGLTRLYNSASRPHFLVYCATNPCRHRDSMFDLFFERHPTGCHARGPCRGNYCRIPGEWKDVPHHIHEYTFMLVMENTDQPGYITEKIANAYLGGCIPIYWGSKQWVKRFFHPDSFINVNDFSSLSSCVDHVIDLYLHHPERLRAMQECPIFTSPSIVDDWYSVFSTDSTVLSPRYKTLVDILQKHVHPSSS